MRGTWFVFLGVAVFVAFVVIAAIAWCLVFYRAGDRRAESFSKNTPLEIVYVVIPCIIVTLLFVLTMRTEIPVDAVAAGPNVNVVSVTAFQWSWRFAYADGRIVTYGTPQAPPTLYLPVGRDTEIVLRSDDVTHSFWVPAFLFKRDAIPGMVNRFTITPTRLGRFLGRCAQFCGLDHALMTFAVDVVPTRAYARFIDTNGADLP